MKILDKSKDGKRLKGIDEQLETIAIRSIENVEKNKDKLYCTGLMILGKYKFFIIFDKLNELC